MFYLLASYLRPYSSIFNVFHYVSFRGMAALLSTLTFSFVLGNWFINKSAIFFKSKVRENTPESHQSKNNLPTMGGIFIISNVLFNCLLWCNLYKPTVWVALLSLVVFGLIGFVDDWCKVKNKKGILAYQKFILQVCGAALVVCSWIYFVNPSLELCFPFFKNLHPSLGLLFIPWAIFIIIACSNAVNLTDGLDGLAIGSLIINFSTFALIAYIAGHAKFAGYLHIPFAGTAELSIVAASLVGASLGFLWYNTYPAQIFMGDVGSLSLGAVLAVIALMTKQELLLLISAGLFVAETLSVIIQVWSFRYLGRRIFRMAPMHHHFELLGWQESKITVRFAIISIILALVTLMTFKIR
jgi:phospho-N-acetylmuramoyl-pentapeptide-transferase